MNKPPNWLPGILLLLAAIGVPSVTIIALAQTVTQHPLLTLGLTLLYEVGILITGVAGRIWQQLENKWIDQMAKWIDLRVQALFVSYQRRYCEYFVYEHRDVDMKGLTIQGFHNLEVNRIFVEINIRPNSAHEISLSPIQESNASNIIRKTIRDYLTSPSLASQHLVIIGAPGSGKTTLLKHIALTMIAQKHHYRPKVSHRLPILLFLREHVDALKKNPDFSLVDAVQVQLKKWNANLPSSWVELRLTRGQNLVLLDGLDEVADPKDRQNMVDWVQQQMVGYGKNRFIVTSRPAGFHNYHLRGATVLELRSFTIEQTEQFVQNWYLANELKSSQKDDPGVRMKAKEGADDLIRRLKNKPALLTLAVNPLLLTMIATVHRFRSRLPGRRVDLYKEICEVFLGKLREARGLSLELAPLQTQGVLESLAYDMMSKGLRDILLEEVQQVITNPLMQVSQQMKAKEFLPYVENISGLLLAREAGVYSFAHLTFQEYLTATYLKEKQEHELISKVGDSWWHETIRLYCAQTDATSVIAACIASNPLTLPILTLAIDCEEEALKKNPTISAQLNTLLNEGLDHADYEWRRVVAQAVINRRLRQLINIDVNMDKETFADNSLITCAEYQMFLNQQPAHDHYQPDHWEDHYFVLNQGRVPVLGMRPSDAVKFCEWLTMREEGPWLYRLPNVGELEKEIDKKNISIKLPIGTGYWVSEGKSFKWVGGSLFTVETDYFDANAITRAIGRDFTYVFDPVHIHALDTDQTDALERARSLTRNIDQSCCLKLVLAHSRDRACFLNLDYILGLDLNLDHVLDLNLDLALKAILTLYIKTESKNHFKDKALCSFLRWYIRFLALVLATHLSSFSQEELLSRSQKGRLFHHPKGKKRGEGMVQRTIENYLDVYLAFAILEERIQGSLPATEGIMIVKEHRK